MAWFEISRDTLIKLLVSSITALFIIIISQGFFVSFKPITDLELKLIDARFQQRGPEFIADSTDVIIIEITQDSYDQIPTPHNSWPWPRYLFANLIQNLKEAGVKAIGIDVMMTDPDRISAEYDSLLATVIKETGMVVVAGKLDVTREAIVSDYESYEYRKETARSVGLIRYLNERYGSIFFEADSSVGITQMPVDNDGILRRCYPFVYSGVTENWMPSFSYAVLNKYFGYPSKTLAESRKGSFLFAGKEVPKFDENSIFINYYGYNRTFPHYKFIDIIDDSTYKTKDEIDLGIDINTWDDPNYGYLHSGIFKDKIVLIGSTMPEDEDLIAVSIGRGERDGDNLMYGVEVHANIIQNFLSNDFLFKQSKLWEILSIFFLTIFTFFVSSNLKQIRIMYSFPIEILNFALVIFFIFFVNLISIYMFINHNLIVAIVSPSLGVLGGYISSTVYQFITEKRKNVLIRGMFSQYVSGELVNQLLSNPQKLGLGGERKNLTILFCDIANFTGFSENKDPEELVRFMNDFLDEMTTIIMNNSGTLDKYLGDAVMAFWGAPLSIKNHAYFACKAAIEMDKKVADIRKKWIKDGESQLNMRIGINTGEVIVGNIGGEKRFDYTVMGDSVNLASRLEGANKNYGTSLMISESTFNEVKDHVLVRELDTIKVKGRKEPTIVFELLGLKGDPESEKKCVKYQSYSSGLSKYKKKNFGEAINFFIECLRINPDDFPSKIYLNRSKFYIENPPDDNWDGVFIMKTK